MSYGTGQKTLPEMRMCGLRHHWLRDGWLVASQVRRQVSVRPSRANSSALEEMLALIPTSAW